MTRPALVVLAALVFAAAGVAAADEPVPLDPLTVTATLSPRATLEVPFAVSSLTRAQFEDLALHSTPDYFTRVAGVYIQKTNLGGGAPFIRGLTGKQALILVDGVRLNNSFYRSGPHQYLNTLDPESIERIEVVRGARSVIYGSDALGGVINIITRDPDSERLSATSTLDSAVAGGALGARSAQTWGPVEVMLGASVKQLGDLEGGGDAGRQQPTAYEEYAADLKLAGVYAGGQWTLVQQFLRQRDVPKTSEVTLGSNAKFEYEPQERSLSFLDYRREFMGPFEELRVNLSLNRMQESENIVARASPQQESHERTEVFTPGLLLHASQAFGAHRLTYGADAYRDLYDVGKERTDLSTGASSELTPGTPDGARYDSYGLFTQDEWRIGAHQVVGGLRYAHIDTRGTVDGQSLALSANGWTGSLHGSFALAPEFALIGGVEQGYRAPNMEDFFARVDFVSTIPNTSLQPEQSLGWELGVKHSGRRMHAELIGFLTDYENLIDRVTVAEGIRQNQNINSARIHGFEIAADASFGASWSGGLTSTYTFGRDRKSGAPLRRMPPWFGAAWLRAQLAPAFWTELELRAADGQDRLSAGDIADPRIGAEGTPGYAIWNLSLGWRAGRGQRMVLTAENLTDRQWKTHGSGIYQPGLSARLAWRWSWQS
jgi:outer membrane receptor protein involved in Fe transport